MKLEIINLQKFYPIDKGIIKKVIKTILKDEKKDAELSIIFIDNKGIREINKTFLKHDYATDVLSFVYHETSFKNTIAKQSRHKTTQSIPLQREIKKPDKTRSRTSNEKKFLQEEVMSGEIIISVEMAIQVAQEGGYSVEGEIILYVIHGLLHLLGYDDKQKSAAKKMHLREKELLVSFGYNTIPVPN